LYWFLNCHTSNILYQCPTYPKQHWLRLIMRDLFMNKKKLIAISQYPMIMDVRRKFIRRIVKYCKLGDFDFYLIIFLTMEYGNNKFKVKCFFFSYEMVKWCYDTKLLIVDRTIFFCYFYVVIITYSKAIFSFWFSVPWKIPPPSK